MNKKEEQASAMDQLFGGLTKPTEPISPSGENTAKKTAPSASSRPLSERQRRYQEANERVCTIVEVELMNKVRYIVGKEGIQIRDVFAAGLRMAIRDYESNHGPIKVRRDKTKKGDAKNVFSI